MRRQGLTISWNPLKKGHSKRDRNLLMKNFSIYCS